MSKLTAVFSASAGVFRVCFGINYISVLEVVFYLTRSFLQVLGFQVSWRQLR